MREDRVADGMSTHVGMCVWGLGSAEERQTHWVSAGCEAVFGVVENRHAVAVFGEVGPFVAADFEFGHVPAVIISNVLQETGREAYLVL